MRCDVIEQNFNIDETTGLRTDKTVVLTGIKSKKLYPEKLRWVEFYDAENDELLVFLTNNFEVSALEVAYLYKNRWQSVNCLLIVKSFKTSKNYNMIYSIIVKS